MKDEIVNWLVSSEMDFDNGASVFIKFCGARKRNLFRVIVRKRDKKTLEYEMKRLLGIPISEIFTQKVSNARLVSNHFERMEIKNKPGVKKNPREEEIIARCKAQIERYFTDIDMWRNELSSFGEGNTSDVVAARVPIVARIRAAGFVYQALYDLKEKYYQRKVSVCEAKEYHLIDEVLREIEETLRIDADKTMAAEEAKKDELSMDVKSLSDVDLLKKRNNMRSTVSRYKNRLDYQSDKKLEEPNPIPAGPKRDKLEKFIKVREELLGRIELELERRAER